MIGVLNMLLATETKSEFPTEIVLGLIFGFLALLLFITVVQRYKRCPSNRILVKYGRTGGGVARCIHGGATFVWPLFQAYDYLDLEPFVVPIDLTNALSQENIRVTVPTSVTAAISNQPGVMENAAVRLLGQTTEQIQSQAQDIIIGQMRAVIATMKIEDINRDRQSFMSKVNEAVAVELEKIGLTVINVNIRDIEDESGYIKAIGRKAAAEAINQANVDVAEQEKRGQMGVAERQRDQRVAVAANGADAEIGEATASRNRRQQVARLDAEAVQAETDANANKASYNANQRVAEESARNRGESAGKDADGSIRVAQEIAQKKAEDARALREQSRLNAEMIVPAEAQRRQVVIAAEAQKEQAINIATGQAEAIRVKMLAEAKGIQAILEAKAEGYRRLVESCSKEPQLAAALLLVEKMAEVASIQAKAIENVKLDKVIIWDGGGSGGQSGLASFGHKLMGILPPLHDVAKNIGLELPEFLGRMAKSSADKPSSEGGMGGKPAAPKPDAPTPPKDAGQK